MPAPLLKRTPGPDLPEPLRSAWNASMELRGDATFMEVFGNHPDLFRWYSESFYGEVFQGGKAPRRLKEMLRLRLSSLHGCRFCNQGNREDARRAGFNEAEITAIESGDNAVFPAPEAAVLALAERLALTTDNGTLDSALLAQLHEAGLDDGQVLELGMVAGILAGMARFLFAYDLVEKEPTCPFHPSEENVSP